MSTAQVENKVFYLKNNRLFSGADERAADTAHIFTTVLYPAKTPVFDQGDPTRLVYLVKKGKVRISRITPDGKEVTVAILGAGDIFGEETLFEAAERTTVATTLEESLLCTARAEDLFELLSRDPELALNVAKIVHERLTNASATIEDLAYARVPDRLLHLFERLAAEHGVAKADGTTIDVRLTHADIASLIGSTRETVTVEIANLVRDGRIRNEKNGRFTLLRRN
ncbi:MAG: Crp/Fnr family transcriptional regulator [Candidatus Eremiobacteraeota bacterium]|nr:Crp/Fnr family transcriptional regulator [Candidatus Eremiobacteraeota bacterium]